MRTIAIAALGLAGCVSGTPPTDGGGPITSGTCDAGKVQSLIGKTSATVAAEAKARSGAKVVRIYATGSVLTMDYSADRLNIETDANGAIVKLSCG